MAREQNASDSMFCSSFVCSFYIEVNLRLLGGEIALNEADALHEELLFESDTSASK